jgi:hypothetical protein
MTALRDPRLEAFAQNLAIGLDIHVAHEKAGFAKDPSRSNSSKAAKKQAVVQRVAEIRQEVETQRLLVTNGAHGFTSRSLVGESVAMARAQADPQALTAIAKILDDGTLGLEADRKPLEIPEILDLSKELGLHTWFNSAVLLMLMDGETGKPLPPWTDGQGRPIPPYLRETKDHGLELVLE